MVINSLPRIAVPLSLPTVLVAVQVYISKSLACKSENVNSDCIVEKSISVLEVVAILLSLLLLHVMVGSGIPTAVQVSVKRPPIVAGVLLGASVMMGTIVPVNVDMSNIKIIHTHKNLRDYVGQYAHVITHDKI